MDNQILKSVIEITGQRDLDSLELSLLASLAELLPVVSIAIYKKHNENITKTVEQVIRLDVTRKENNTPEIHWSNAADIVATDKLTERCLLSSNLALSAVNDEHDSAFPITVESTTIGALRIHSQNDLTTHKELIENIVKIYSNYLVILMESERDKLTGLYNRRTFDKKLDRLLKTQVAKQDLDSETPDKRRPHKDTEHAWLVVLDFDNFKTVNDTYGHIYGDEILLTLSQKMKTFFRNSDLLFRFGGDEFVIILEPVSYASASRILEKFRKSIADTPFPLIGKITISAGFAAISENDFAPTVLNRADKALYHAKELGRNRVCNYEDLMTQGTLKKVESVGSIDLF